MLKWFRWICYLSTVKYIIHFATIQNYCFNEIPPLHFLDYCSFSDIDDQFSGIWRDMVACTIDGFLFG